MSSTTLPAAVQRDSYVTPSMPKKTAKQEYDMQTFIQLLTTQLSNQNPMEPMDDSAFFAQIAQLGQVQGLESLNNQGKVQQANELMGKRITAARSGATTDVSLKPTVEGIVRRLSIQNGEYKLVVEEPDGKLTDVKMDQIQSVENNKNAMDYSHLVGKSVKGTVANQAVEGKVLGVNTINGNIVLEVQSGGNKINLPVENVTNIKE